MVTPQKLRALIAIVASVLLVAGGMKVAADGGSSPAAGGKDTKATSKDRRGQKSSSKTGGKTSEGSAIKPPAGAEPRAGVYTYTVRKSGQKGSETILVRIEAPVTRASGHVQRFIEQRPGASGFTALTKEWRDGSLLLIHREAVSERGNTTECDFAAPNNTLVKFPLRVGSQWTTTWALCGGAQPTLAKVVDRTPVTIGGVKVDTYAIRSVISAGGAVQTLTDWYAPAWHMRLLSTLTVKTASKTITYTTKLKSLLPS
jgi:hypothetical protein